MSASRASFAILNPARTLNSLKVIRSGITHEALTFAGIDLDKLHNNILYLTMQL